MAVPDTNHTVPADASKQGPYTNAAAPTASISMNSDAHLDLYEMSAKRWRGHSDLNVQVESKRVRVPDHEQALPRRLDTHHTREDTESHSMGTQNTRHGPHFSNMYRTPSVSRHLQVQPTPLQHQPTSHGYLPHHPDGMQLYGETSDTIVPMHLQEQYLYPAFGWQQDAPMSQPLSYTQGSRDLPRHQASDLLPGQLPQGQYHGDLLHQQRLQMERAERHAHIQAIHQRLKELQAEEAASLPFNARSWPRQASQSTAVEHDWRANHTFARHNGDILSQESALNRPPSVVHTATSSNVSRVSTPLGSSSQGFQSRVGTPGPHVQAYGGLPPMSHQSVAAIPNIGQHWVPPPPFFENQSVQRISTPLLAHTQPKPTPHDMGKGKRAPRGSKARVVEATSSASSKPMTSHVPQSQTPVSTHLPVHGAVLAMAPAGPQFLPSHQPLLGQVPTPRAPTTPAGHPSASQIAQQNQAQTSSAPQVHAQSHPRSPAAIQLVIQQTLEALSRGQMQFNDLPPNLRMAIEHLRRHSHAVNPASHQVLGSSTALNTAGSRVSESQSFTHAQLTQQQPYSTLTGDDSPYALPAPSSYTKGHAALQSTLANGAQGGLALPAERSCTPSACDTSKHQAKESKRAGPVERRIASLPRVSRALPVHHPRASPASGTRSSELHPNATRIGTPSIAQTEVQEIQSANGSDVAPNRSITPLRVVETSAILSTNDINNVSKRGNVTSSNDPTQSTPSGFAEQQSEADTATVTNLTQEQSDNERSTISDATTLSETALVTSVAKIVNNAQNEVNDATASPTPLTTQTKSNIQRASAAPLPAPVAESPFSWDEPLSGADFTDDEALFSAFEDITARMRPLTAAEPPDTDITSGISSQVNLEQSGDLDNLFFDFTQPREGSEEPSTENDSAEEDDERADPGRWFRSLFNVANAALF
ncbi:hypothetical protein D9619_006906 [Psilocybe cf. subviscida]|uniref:Uncharacterized protein n=1 Tax=Psilocybe cf. subviscida TaxID=2480587 RepID=A0A8H5B4D3_9AGAR|nr:hypothetical protein D9619_006906 [Psilocybe cf. subviscida]